MSDMVTISLPTGVEDFEVRDIARDVLRQIDWRYKLTGQATMRRTDDAVVMSMPVEKK